MSPAAARTRRPNKRPPARSPKPAVTVAAGCLWTAVLTGAVAAGPAVTAVLTVPIAVVASVSSVRSVAGRKVTPRVGLAVVVSVLLPLAAIGGPIAWSAVAGVAAAAGGAWIFVAAGRVPRLSLVLCVFAPAVAASSLVLAGTQGTSNALALVGAICAYDAGAFIMGTGKNPLGGIAGVVAGFVSTAVVAVFVAAVLDPPYSGARPWVVFGLVAAAAAAGIAVADRAVRGTRLPAWRRLDSLFVAGPVWVVVVAAVLHR